MYFCVYATYWKCAVELSNVRKKNVLSIIIQQYNSHHVIQVKVEQTWVAESYEPLFLRCEKQEMDYVVVNEDLLFTRYPNAKSLRRNLVGTISLVNHR